jgi:hypothetical protein
MGFHFPTYSPNLYHAPSAAEGQVARLYFKDILCELAIWQNFVSCFDLTRRVALGHGSLLVAWDDEAGGI